MFCLLKRNNHIVDKVSQFIFHGLRLCDHDVVNSWLAPHAGVGGWRVAVCVSRRTGAGGGRYVEVDEGKGGYIELSQGRTLKHDFLQN